MRRRGSWDDMDLGGISDFAEDVRTAFLAEEGSDDIGGYIEEG